MNIKLSRNLSIFQKVYITFGVLTTPGFLIGLGAYRLYRKLKGA